MADAVGTYFRRDVQYNYYSHRSHDVHIYLFVFITERIWNKNGRSAGLKSIIIIFSQLNYISEEAAVCAVVQLLGSQEYTHTHAQII
jgi:hypothetical protein